MTISRLEAILISVYEGSRSAPILTLNARLLPSRLQNSDHHKPLDSDKETQRCGSQLGVVHLLHASVSDATSG